VAAELLPVERELRAEKAAALAIAAEKLEQALAQLADAQLAFEAAPEQSPERQKLADRHQALRAHAAERLWFMLVQREAMGLTQHDNVLAFYRVPPALRKVAGPRLRPATSPGTPTP
jgi:phage-related minor tail protein